MTWQTILSIIIMAATGGLMAASGQYPADKVPSWLPIALGAIGALGTALRGVGVTSIGAAKAPVKPPMPMAPQPVADEVSK